MESIEKDCEKINREISINGKVFIKEPPVMGCFGCYFESSEVEGCFSLLCTTPDVIYVLKTDQTNG